ncbi:zf-HC2 domain-containing protein [Streptomyces sp. AV19]|uniref:zf-HC2 domain-containing protein n=2 Tax=Streptomyces sp. AV19 TaxID=2793068 RepID=UPI001F20FB65|nr:zf-HC2 domain-containing protein [Streptomyces sp. AV19]MDG4534214.1 zf-HC2 domain-containing protein [Streptomyces sp. AV19]
MDRRRHPPAGRRPVAPGGERRRGGPRGDRRAGPRGLRRRPRRLHRHLHARLPARGARPRVLPPAGLPQGRRRARRHRGRGPAPAPAGAPTALHGPPGPAPARRRRPPMTTHATRPHRVLKSLLGAWALAACSAEETAAVEEHLTDCAACADEALRLRDAVALLHHEESLDLDPGLRSRVLAHCLGRRPAKIPVPAWAAPYEAETARLDALLRDIDDADWTAPVRLTWFDGRAPAEREVDVAAVITHLTAVDGLVAGFLGLPAPPAASGEAPAGTHATWRDQSRALIRSASFAKEGTAERTVEYGPFSLPLSDAFLDRAFECWVHAEDVAEAVAYPYTPPSPSHMHHMIDLAARLLPRAIAGRRRAGLAPPPHTLTTAGAPGRALHLEIEGSGGGHWYIALDSPAAKAAPGTEVAHVALDGLEFCRLAAGRMLPQEAAAGQDGDREAVRDVLFATASLSRM